MNAMRSRTLIRKTSLLRKIVPIARRSSFAKRIIYNPPSASRLMSERRNDPEIMKYRATIAARSNSDRSPLYDVRNHACRVLGEDDGCETMFSRTMIETLGRDAGNQTIWWSQTGSNRRPHACKARALPAELWPRNQKTNAHSMKVVGLGRLELPTSRLSSARSNQLSYKPLTLIR